MQSAWEEERPDKNDPNYNSVLMVRRSLGPRKAFGGGGGNRGGGRRFQNLAGTSTNLCV